MRVRATAPDAGGTPSPRRRALVAGLAVAATVVAVGGAVATTAAWNDQVSFGATAVASDAGFDIRARTLVPSDDGTGDLVLGDWVDIGLPGNPDTDTFGEELVTAPVEGVQPDSNYAVPIYLCNAGDVDATIVDAELVTADVLVEQDSVNVDTISIGTVIPRNSCNDDDDQVVGHIQFTTTEMDATGNWSWDASEEIHIRIFCRASAP
ncbi:hypothetical protein [Agromyces larvae]|uniref:SipW-cognate class signal peptide n=1 Tax=Agromyces larvae TaxID=2929802 RepID=A0ABY4C071_9MICO|nr:hypothetical protein [Agromyces larvae]UOE43817.1 hypothetical protein MTO99_16860 [Agromyces larvae]